MGEGLGGGKHDRRARALVWKGVPWTVPNARKPEWQKLRKEEAASSLQGGLGWLWRCRGEEMPSSPGPMGRGEEAGTRELFFFRGELLS